MKFTATGAWFAMQRMLDPQRFNDRLEREVAKATVLNGRIAAKKIRDEIKKGAYEENADLTKILKAPKTKPLIGKDGALWAAIGHEVVDSWSTFVGVIKSVKGRSEEELIDIAEVLHDGQTITVTQQMRDFFKMLTIKTGGAVKPLKPSTEAIVIPARPFLENALKDPQLAKVINDNWQIAVSNALYDLRQPFNVTI